MKVER